MDLLLVLLCLLIVLSMLAWLANRSRRIKDYNFKLEPNCLMTRWPVVFVTGPRSFFYFARYWNMYPAFLAEHGYEVFTVHLPWNSRKLRRLHLRAFLKEQSRKNRHFHLIMDSHTLMESQGLFHELRPACAKSITEIANADSMPVLENPSDLPLPFQRLETLGAPHRAPRLLRWSYALHRHMIRSAHLSELSTLGALDETALVNSKLLLARVQQLAETDMRDF